MGITKEILLYQMGRIELNYGKERFKVDQDMFDLWYEMFSDCDENGFRLAVDKYMKENEFAPNIAGIMKCYRTLEDEKNDLKETIKHQYTTMRCIWGEEYDKDTFNEIVNYVMRFPKNMRKVEMIELQQRACSFAHDCDVCGRVIRPTIKEYVMGER